jgi:hypothetical protein
MARLRRRHHQPPGARAIARHHLIDIHRARLAERLPAAVVDELSDGLTETYEYHLASGLPPTKAARVAVAEFGDPDRIADEFVAHAPGRRTARLLLATGPIMGASWAGSLVATKAWTWPIPPLIVAVYALTLLVVVAALAAAATTTHHYRLTYLGSAAALALVLLDGIMITAATTVIPNIAWPMAIAIPASLVRIGIITHAVPKTLRS